MTCILSVKQVWYRINFDNKVDNNKVLSFDSKKSFTKEMSSILSVKQVWYRINFDNKVGKKV